MKIQIAPSILSADFSRLGDEIRAVEKAGADIIHIDVMDGHFVPNITIGPPVVASIRKTTRLPLDCHLMLEEPEKYIEPFAKAGADWISVHVETCDLSKILSAIKKLGCRAGAVINPPTPIEKIYPFAKYSDFILIMTVNPGFGGQSYIDSCTKKIADLKKFLDENKIAIPIQVDGGIKASNVSTVIDAGADIIVAGSEVFGKKDYGEAIRSLRKSSPQSRL
jgi:ribulose-phosphate 3-epimerase